MKLWKGVAILALGSIISMADESDFRKWTSSTGSTLRAQLVGIDEGAREAILQREDGSKLTVPFHQLSVADREFLTEEISRMPKADPDESVGDGSSSIETALTQGKPSGRPYLHFPEGSDELGFDGHWYRETLSNPIREAIRSRLSKTPQLTQPVSRKDIPAIAVEDDNGDEIGSGLISHFYWWDSIGLIPFGKDGELDEKIDYLDRKLRWNPADDFEEFPAELFDFLEKEHHDTLSQVNMTLVEHTTPELLQDVTTGVDLVISQLDATNQRLSNLEWVSRITIIESDGVEFTFQMWGTHFKARMEPIAEGLNIGRNFPPVEVHIIPDPLNEQIPYLLEDDCRLFLARETLILSPVLKNEAAR
ncbi:MAG: hypothetical protein AAF491_09795 [Verrucomicrobiota bacterium]